MRKLLFVCTCVLSVTCSREKIEDSRGLMENTMQSMPKSPYVLVPALTLAGLLPWIVPGIRLAAGFVQIVNQVAFMAGLAALVRSYIFDARPDEHIVYVNHGYGTKGHSSQHNKDY